MPAARLHPTQRVLFVGNSLIYYNDLPSKFAALHKAIHPGAPLQVEMLAAGGASLSDRLRDGSLDDALARTRYDVVVLQDFGAWPLCSTEIPACAASSQPLRESVARVRRSGARALWFATWMPTPAMQRALSAASAQVARDTGVEYADVGAAIHAAAARASGWLHADGHPASAGSWLAAASTLRALEPDASLPKRPPHACGQRWQGAGLRGDVPASRQHAPARDCNAPGARQWAVIRSVLAAPADPSRTSP